MPEEGRLPRVRYFGLIDLLAYEIPGNVFLFALIFWIFDLKNLKLYPSLNPFLSIGFITLFSLLGGYVVGQMIYPGGILIGSISYKIGNLLYKLFNIGYSPKESCEHQKDCDARKLEACLQKVFSNPDYLSTSIYRVQVVARLYYAMIIPSLFLGLSFYFGKNQWIFYVERTHCRGDERGRATDS